MARFIYYYIYTVITRVYNITLHPIQQFIQSVKWTTIRPFVLILYSMFIYSQNLFITYDEQDLKFVLFIYIYFFFLLQTDIRSAVHATLIIIVMDFKFLSNHQPKQRNRKKYYLLQYSIDNLFIFGIIRQVCVLIYLNVF